MAAVGVAPPGVVASRPAEDLSATGLLVGEGNGAGEGLSFEGGVERLGERVVGARADAAEGQGDADLVAELGVVLGGVLGCVIGVDDGSSQRSSFGQGGLEGVGDQ